MKLSKEIASIEPVKGLSPLRARVSMARLKQWSMSAERLEIGNEALRDRAQALSSSVEVALELLEPIGTFSATTAKALDILRGAL